VRVLDLYRDDLTLESAGGQGLTEPPFRRQGLLLLILSGYLKLLGQILDLPWGCLFEKASFSPSRSMLS